MSAVLKGEDGRMFIFYLQYLGNEAAILILIHL